MVYEFNPKVVNHNNVDSFFNEKNFVGYILPDGSIFECINHNLTDADAFIRLYLPILDNDYHIKDELLNTNTDNKLTALMAKRLKNMSHEMIHALKDYIEKNKLFLSDVLVSFFGCHLVTRLHKEILTSESNHACFFNYLLNDFKITTVGKLIYDEEKKEFKYVVATERNDSLYDEIKQIKEEVKANEINLFYKGR